MKYTFFENDNGTELQLTPETPEEVAQLARMVMNSKKQKAEIYLSFSGSPYCNIWMSKVRVSHQNKSISNS